MHPLPHISALRRFLAGSSAALVLLLGVLAACPNLHNLLHHDSDQESHGCAVVLFAGGVTPAVATAVVTAPDLAWHGRPAIAVDELFLASPRWLRHPERGPPAC